MRIIELLILGNSVADTAKTAEVSESTVRNVQTEFNAGKIAGYESFVDCLPDLKWAAAKFRENGVTVEKAAVGWATYETIAKLGLPGLDPKEFNTALTRLLKLLPPDFPSDKLVNAAVALLKIEVETGLSYEEMIKAAQGLATKTKALEDNILSLTQQKASFERTIADLQKQTEEAYQKKQLTEKQANEVSGVLKRLVAAGITLEDLEKLRQVLMVARSEGWRPKDIIRSLATIGNLQSRIQNLQSQLTNLQNTISHEDRTLGVLRSQVEAVQNQLVALFVSANAVHDRLTQLQTLTLQEQLQRQTVDVFFKLLSDPSAVTDEQHYQFTEQTMKACLSGKLAVGLPVDYRKLREEMQFLVEAALGKQFVSRETYEEEVKALREQNSDLLLGGIITLEREHAKLTEVRTELAEVSAEEIITDLAEQNLDLEIVVFKCPECHSLGSCCRLPGTKPRPLRCPSCSSDKIKIRGKLRTTKPIKAYQPQTENTTN
jgi:rubrerythrin